MSKCSGVIGYVLSEETQPGVWTPTPIEKQYYGDVIIDNRRIVDANQINDNVTINNNISVVSNKFMLDNMAYMKYATFQNSKWQITSVSIKSPRILITLGGLYNG